MTSVQTTTTQPAVPTVELKDRRERVPEGADFGDLFALFAQNSSRGAARNGSLSLQVGSAGGGRSGWSDAQQLRQGQADGAPGGPGLREQSRLVEGKGSERLSDRLARAARDRGVADRSDQRIGDRANPSQDAGASTTDRVGSRAGASASGQTVSAKSDASGAAGAETGSQVEGNPAGVVASGGAAQVRSAQGAAAGNNAVSSINTGSNAGSSSQQGANASMLLGGQAGQTRMKAGASQRSEQAPAPTPKETAAFKAQLARGLGAALRSGRGEVTLRLRPTTLGELQVRVQIKDSIVEAQIRPSTIEAHRLLTQSVDALRHSFEARGLQVGRIEIEQPPASKEGSGGATHQGHPGGQDGQFGMGRESDGHLSKDSTAARAARLAGGSDSQHAEAEEVVMSDGYGSPGIVYSVTDGAARIVMIDALA